MHQLLARAFSPLVALIRRAAGTNRRATHSGDPELQLYPGQQQILKTLTGDDYHGQLVAAVDLRNLARSQYTCDPKFLTQLAQHACERKDDRVRIMVMQSIAGFLHEHNPALAREAKHLATHLSKLITSDCRPTSAYALVALSNLGIGLKVYRCETADCIAFVQERLGRPIEDIRDEEIIALVIQLLDRGTIEERIPLPWILQLRPLDRAAIAPLYDALLFDPNVTVRGHAAAALYADNRQASFVLESLVRLLAEGDGMERCYALLAIHEGLDNEGIGRASDLLVEQSDLFCRLRSFECARTEQLVTRFGQILALLGHDDPNLRFFVLMEILLYVEWKTVVDVSSAMPWLRRTAEQDSDDYVQLVASWILDQYHNIERPVSNP